MWGAVFIVNGISVAICGKRLFVYVLFSFGALTMNGLVLLLCYSTFLTSDTSTAVNWLVVSMAVFGGLITGWLLTKIERLGACLLAGWAGFVLGVFINEAFVMSDSIILHWSITILLFLIAAGLASIWFNEAIMFSTALVGSYFFIRGVGIYAGGFPNEYVLIHQMSDQAMFEWKGRPLLYVYMSGVLVCTVFGTVV